MLAQAFFLPCITSMTFAICRIPILLLVLLLVPASCLPRAYSIIEVEHPSTISGQVKWDGDLPEPFRFEVNTDAIFCGEQGHIDRDLVHIDSRTKGVQNAIVYLSDIDAGVALTTAGLGNRGALHFNDCVLTPRASIMPEGTLLEFVSQDDIVHWPQLTLNGNMVREELTSPGMRRAVIMRDPGVYEVRCGRHMWEYATVFVTNHPYYATTSATGNFIIPNVPAGSYTLQMWRPSLAPKPVVRNGVVVDYDVSNSLVQELRINVRPDEPLEVDFLLPAGGGHLR
jgi:hypothetical protein